MNNEFEKPDPEGVPTMNERLARIERRMVRGFRAQQNRAAQHLCAVMFVITVLHYTKADSFDWKSWWHGWSDALTGVADRVFVALQVHSRGLPTVYPGDLIALAVMGLLLVYCVGSQRQLPGQEKPRERLAFRLGQALRRIVRTR
jgi:hypothetical protein